MKFQCQGCQTDFAVPDERIPAGKEVRVLCPRCKKPAEARDSAVTPAPQFTTGEGPSAADGEFHHIQEEMSLLDMVDEDVRTALLCSSTPGRAEKVRSVVGQMGFHAVMAQSASLAIKKLQNNRYDLIVFEEMFDSKKPSENLFLHHIQLLPMHVRRKFFVCLMSEKQATLDQMLAFRVGVDLVFNTKDLEKMKVILTRAIKDQQGIYRVFTDELARKGQR